MLECGHRKARRRDSHLPFEGMPPLPLTAPRPFAAWPGELANTLSSACVFTCFFRSCGRLKDLPQKSHLCGLSGT